MVSTFNRLITIEGYAKVLHINTSYLHIRGSTYYYSRRVPQDLQEKYSTKKIVVSLRTKSKRTALLSSSHLSMELEGYWSSIRIKRVVKKYIHTPDSSSLTLSGITIDEAKGCSGPLNLDTFQATFPIRSSSERVSYIQSPNESFCSYKSRYNFLHFATTSFGVQGRAY